MEHVALHLALLSALRAGRGKARRPIERSTSQARTRSPGSASALAFRGVVGRRCARRIALVAGDGRAGDDAIPGAGSRSRPRFGRRGTLQPGKTEAESRLGSWRHVGRRRGDSGGAEAIGVGGGLVVDGVGGGLVGGATSGLELKTSSASVELSLTGLLGFL